MTKPLPEYNSSRAFKSSGLNRSISKVFGFLGRRGKRRIGQLIWSLS